METTQFGLCGKEILGTVQLGCVRLSSDPPLIESRVVSPVRYRADSARVTMAMMTTRVFPTAAVYCVWMCVVCLVQEGEERRVRER